MPVRNDFLCEVCGHYGEYWATRATAPSHCGQVMTWAPSRPPAVDAKEPFQQFDVEINGQRHHVGSLHQMRQIERQAEQAARNGEGQPHIWRDYSNDRTNFDVHTLAKHTTRPMSAQDGYAGGIDAPVKTSRITNARGADVIRRHGEVPVNG